MASYTTFLELKKPALNEAYAIGDFNDNADKIDEAISDINDDLDDLDADVANATSKAKTNITVEIADWNDDDTYEDFPYKADITVTGVDASYYADVILSPADALSGNFAPVCLVGTNKVSIYAAEVPEAPMVVLAIKFDKVVSL